MKRGKKIGRTLTRCAIAFLVGIQLVGCGATGIAQGADAKQRMASAMGMGRAAPDFTLKDLGGTEIRLSNYKGDRYVLLYFWATWCPYCIQAKPQIAKLREKFGANVMEVLGINVGGGDSLEKLKRYQEGHPVSWPILYDGEGLTTRAYQIQGIPLFVLVDREGNVAYRGNILPEDLQQFMK